MLPKCGTSWRDPHTVHGLGPTPPHCAALLTAACSWGAWRCMQAAVLSRTFGHPMPAAK